MKKLLTLLAFSACILSSLAPPPVPSYKGTFTGIGVGAFSGDGSGLTGVEATGTNSTIHVSTNNVSLNTGATNLDFWSSSSVIVTATNRGLQADITFTAPLMTSLTNGYPWSSLYDATNAALNATNGYAATVTTQLQSATNALPRGVTGSGSAVATTNAGGVVNISVTGAGGDVLAAGQNNFSGSNYFGGATKFLSLPYGLTDLTNSYPWGSLYVTASGQNNFSGSNYFGGGVTLESATFGTVVASNLYANLGTSTNLPAASVNPGAFTGNYYFNGSNQFVGTINLQGATRVGQGSFIGTNVITYDDGAGAASINSHGGTRTFLNDATHTVITNTATLTSSEWTAGSQKEWYNGGVTMTIDKTNGTVTATGNLGLSTLGITIDGGGSAITSGAKGFIEVPTGCIIKSGTLLADQNGSIQIEAWRTNDSNLTLVSRAGALGTNFLTSTNFTRDATLAGWTGTTLAANDVIEFYVTTNASAVTRVTYQLKVQK